MHICKHPISAYHTLLPSILLYKPETFEPLNLVTSQPDLWKTFEDFVHCLVKKSSFRGIQYKTSSYARHLNWGSIEQRWRI